MRTAQSWPVSNGAATSSSACQMWLVSMYMHGSLQSNKLHVKESIG